MCRSTSISFRKPVNNVKTVVPAKALPSTVRALNRTCIATSPIRIQPHRGTTAALHVNSQKQEQQRVVCASLEEVEVPESPPDVTASVPAARSTYTSSYLDHDGGMDSDGEGSMMISSRRSATEERLEDRTTDDRLVMHPPLPCSASFSGSFSSGSIMSRPMPLSYPNEYGQYPRAISISPQVQHPVDNRQYRLSSSFSHPPMPPLAVYSEYESPNEEQSLHGDRSVRDYYYQQYHPSARSYNQQQHSTVAVADPRRHRHSFPPSSCPIVKQQHKKFFIFLKTMLRLMNDDGEVELSQRVKHIVAECTYHNRAGNPNYFPLQDSVAIRLRALSGGCEAYWNRTRDYLGYDCYNVEVLPL